MSRKPNINWRKGDTEKLTKLVKRFNAKINYVTKAHPEIANAQPQKIKKADKQKMIEELKNLPRSEFNKQLKSLERYLKRGAEQIVKNDFGFATTKWDKRETMIKGAQLNRERTKERKIAENAEVTSRGEAIGLKRGEMGSVRMNELKTKKIDFSKIKSRTEWIKLKQSLDKQVRFDAKLEKQNLYKLNYIKALTKVTGGYGKELIEKLKQLPAEKVNEIFYREQEASIEFLYDPQEMFAILEIVNEIWDKAYNENSNIATYENWTTSDESKLQEWIEKGW